MIGKPEWFARRKYGGWGLNPKTWQGWSYVGIFILAIMLLNLFPYQDLKTRLIVEGILVLVFILDIFDIMRKIKLDEREKIHEAISERNALWTILIILVAGLLYDIINSSLTQEVKINPFVFSAIIIGAIVKTITNIYLDRKN